MRKDKVSDTKVDPGGGALREAQHFAPLGDDAHPLAGDYAVAVAVQGSRLVVVGYVDPKNAQSAQPGERRIYARDASGAEVCSVWLKSDGSIVAQNANGVLTLEAGGDVVGNGARMTTDGDVVTSDGISLRGHSHAQGPDSAGNTQAETEAPTV